MLKKKKKKNFRNDNLILHLPNFVDKRARQTRMSESSLVTWCPFSPHIPLFPVDHRANRQTAMFTLMSYIGLEEGACVDSVFVLNHLV